MDPFLNAFILQNRSPLAGKVFAAIFAILRLIDNHYTALFLDESMNALYLPLLSAYAVMALGLSIF